jgi:Sec-independent protein secretion pathway component TatC
MLMSFLPLILMLVVSFTLAKSLPHRERNAFWIAFLIVSLGLSALGMPGAATACKYAVVLAFATRAWLRGPR